MATSDLRQIPDVVVGSARFSAPSRTNSSAVTNLKFSTLVVPLRFRVFSSKNLGSVHGLLPPLSALIVSQPVGFSVFRGIRLQSSNQNILSCACAPPRRLHPEPAAPLLMPYVSRKTCSKGSLRLKLLCPSAFADLRALLFTPLLEERPDTVALISGSHTPGFGYPFDVSFNSQTLGSLFQPPTLRGFPLQSFPPLK